MRGTRLLLATAKQLEQLGPVLGRKRPVDMEIAGRHLLRAAPAGAALTFARTVGTCDPLPAPGAEDRAAAGTYRGLVQLATHGIGILRETRINRFVTTCLERPRAMAHGGAPWMVANACNDDSSLWRPFTPALT
ncbi:hypothetical protein DM46_365 [Burkholderia mallei]|nr:hypothetical protein DM46_365 [Burkholderia mallei]